MGPRVERGGTEGGAGWDPKVERGGTEQRVSSMDVFRLTVLSVNS